MLTSYYTVKQFGEHEIVIQKSRFIAYLERVTTEAEAMDFIARIKKQHANATHNCSAYIIGENDEIQKANDDGEPSGTAGVPMLEVLKKRKLKDTAVVVTRYFGGIKLGAGGLIRAYGSSTSEGLNHIGVVERQLMDIFTVTVDYTWIGKVENELRESSFDLMDIRYEEQATFFIYVPVAQNEEFHNWITNMTSAQAKIAAEEQTYIEVDVTDTSGRE
ncbi:YigZ family protein [Salsuginibacillus kocurii]|uniref:YigZ family protein n=1 Tax=Salsuginibacillus kocurii TaxID=427078 RepID=UPI00035DF9D6|nr:YigZ family protein [Salsuginibacillus kocurii]